MSNLERRCKLCGWITSNKNPHSTHCDGTFEYLKGETTEMHVTPSNNVEIRTVSATGGQKGVKLERFDLIPIGPLTHLARHYGRGAQKYADHQWRKGIEPSKLYAALQRHLTTWFGGVELDTCPPNQEGCAFVTNEGEPFEGVPGVSCYNHTGSHHLDAVMWMAFALRDGVDNHPELDDRYIVEMKTEENRSIDKVNTLYDEALLSMRQYENWDHLPKYVCKFPTCKNPRQPDRSFCDDCVEIP